MMNRSVMGRQMFAAGGAAFPDISGDGQVTQKDILMGRGVLPRPMQEGGIADPMMMQGMDPSMVPQEDPMMAQQGEVDPEVLAGMFGQMETQMSGIEDSEDLESMMNAVRGDQQPVEARRAELASFVGPEDAQVTPESVLALVQPVMQLASLDQGIGGLAEAEMSGVSMEGPMGEGIMSTVNTAPDAAPMPPPTGQAMMDPAMMGVGNPPPVNFRQGGVVQYMEDGGSPIQDAYNERAFYDELIKDYTVDDQAMLDDRKQMAKSQMFFDLAQAGLEFASPGQRQESPAESLARAFKNTDFFPKLGARGQSIQDLKDKQNLSRRAASQSLMPSRLAASEAQVAADRAAQAAFEKAQITAAEKGYTNIMIPGMKGTLMSVPNSQVESYSGLGYGLATKLSSSGEDFKRVNFRKPSGEVVTAEAGTPLYYQYLNVDKYPETGPAKQPSASERAAQIQNFAMIGDPTKVKRLDLNDPTDLATLKSLDREKWVKAGSQTLTIDTGPKLSDTQQILSNVTLMNSYGDGTASPQDVATIEAAIGQAYEPVRTEENGYVTYRSPPVPSLVKDAHKDRRSAGLQTSRFVTIFPKETPVLDVVRELDSISDVAPLTQADIVSRSNKIEKILAATAEAYSDQFTDGSVPIQVLRSRAFNDSLVKANGTIDLDSESWRMVPTTLYGKDIPYGQSRGLGSAFDRAIKNIGESVRETGVGENRLDLDDQQLFQADADFRALKLQTLSQLTDAVNNEGGRVLKSVQDQINEILEPLEPGIFSFDGGTLATIKAVRNQLALGLQAQIENLPEYPNGRETEKTASARAKSKSLRNLIAEYTKFNDHLEQYLQIKPSAGSSSGSGADKNFFLELARKEEEA